MLLFFLGGSSSSDMTIFIKTNNDAMIGPCQGDWEDDITMMTSGQLTLPDVPPSEIRVYLPALFRETNG